MSYQCKIIVDSIAPNGKIITTFQITFPRSILSEFNTHRAISKNSASSRAIPIERVIKMVEEDPYIPIFTGAKAGMQGEDRSEDKTFQENAISHWLLARDNAILNTRVLLEGEVHKQDANRLLEPWMWHTVIATATDWANFFALRCHPMAHPAIQTIANMIRDAKLESVPVPLKIGEWHLPYITEEDRAVAMELAILKTSIASYHPNLINEYLLIMSVARCARVSYGHISYGGKCDVKTFEKDSEIYNRLLNAQPGHMSPLEHQATPAQYKTFQSGNFNGWIQNRHTIVNESTNSYEYNGKIIQ